MGKGYTIAISGKGGVGKTVVSAYLIKRFAKQGTVLAQDADPGSNLAQVLSVPTDKTVVRYVSYKVWDDFSCGE